MIECRKKTLGITLTLLISACATPPPERNMGRLGLEPKVPEVDMGAYSAPDTAGAFELRGRMDVPDSQRTLFRYQLPGAPERKLDIALYPLPPGWHDLPEERVVSGHYGQVRQSFVDRARRRGNLHLRAMQERLRRDEASDRLVAEGVLLEESGDRARLIVLQIAALPKVFVRLTASAPEAVGQEQLEDARSALTAFLRHQQQSAVAP